MGTLLTYGSLALAAVNITVTLLIGHGKPYGWLAAIAIQIPWSVYDVATRQWGFLLITAVTVPTYLREYRHRRRGKETGGARPSPR